MFVEWITECMEGFPADVDALEVDSCGCCVQEPSKGPFSFNTAQYLPMETRGDNSPHLHPRKSLGQSNKTIQRMQIKRLGTWTVFTWAWLASTARVRSLFNSPSAWSHFHNSVWGKNAYYKCLLWLNEKNQFLGHSDFRWQGGVIWATSCPEDSRPLENPAWGSFLYFTQMCPCLFGWLYS